MYLLAAHRRVIALLVNYTVVFAMSSTHLPQRFSFIKTHWCFYIRFVFFSMADYVGFVDIVHFQLGQFPISCLRAPWDTVVGTVRWRHHSIRISQRHAGLCGRMIDLPNMFVLNSNGNMNKLYSKYLR